MSETDNKDVSDLPEKETKFFVIDFLGKILIKS